MKISIKTIAVFLAIILVLIEGYLITSYLVDKNNESNQVNSYCSVHCDYNPASFLWEFSSDTYTKGFTTREECFNYCSKVKQGFAYNLVRTVSPASLLNSIKSLFQK